MDKLKVRLAIRTINVKVYSMIGRNAEQAIREFQKGYPVISITGPRQSGKTTLTRELFKDRDYVTFEDPDTRQRASEDPRNFLKRYEKGAIFDEVQRVPEIISYLQGIVDKDPSKCRFILTGSQQFGLLSKISQSLAGRTALIHLLPFSVHEIYSNKKKFPDLDTVLFSGLYPPVHDRHLKPEKWYAQYVNTYIERDVRQLANIKDLTVFQRFIRLCAARCGSLLSLSNLAADTGVSHTTIRSWLSILEASYLIYFLPPHYRNFGKRLVKTPKIYFYDSGLLCWLLSIASIQQLNIHPLRGAIFESFVISELKKYRYNRGESADFYFWRDKRGLEIDIVAEHGSKLLGAEVKSASTFNPCFIDGIRKWRNLSGEKAGDSFLVYGGNENFEFQNVQVLGWADPVWLKKIAG